MQEIKRVGVCYMYGTQKFLLWHMLVLLSVNRRHISKLQVYFTAYFVSIKLAMLFHPARKRILY